MDKSRLNTLIFGGTSEGRELAEIFDYLHINCTICVATEYGEKLLPSSEYVNVLCGRMDSDEIYNLLSDNNYSYVIDATHPYAALISDNIKLACGRHGTKYLRLLRKSSENIINNEDNITRFTDIAEAAKYLNTTSGNIFLTTGSKELSVFCKELNDTKRITARVLPSISVLQLCKDLDLEGHQIIAMQGPFSEEINTAMLKQTKAKYLVTKEGGKAGGFPEKILAAKSTGAEIILITRPVNENGYSPDEILNILGIKNITRQRYISIIGAGIGNTNTFTYDCKKALNKANLIIGSKRLLETVNTTDKATLAEYNAEKILKFIKDNPQFTDIAILLSGDIGFYSGAKKLITVLSEYNVTLIPGISSVVYFAAKLKTEWQDMKLISLHGRNQNVITAIKMNYKTFILLNNKDGVSNLAKVCLKYGLNELTFHIGCNLGYDSEKIISGSPSDFTDYNVDALHVAIVENRDAEKYIITHGLPDNSFIRGDVPMTKEEVREISISKLQLTNDAVVYDIGAGTGSISVECALQAYNGRIYAIEKKEEALKLIEQNRLIHGAENLTIISGTAPEALDKLEPPTHAFIGGSSGSLTSIIETLFAKNENVRIVINAISLETIAEISNYLQTSDVNADITCISVSKAKTLKNYHLMTGLNPVWIVVLSR